MEAEEQRSIRRQKGGHYCIAIGCTNEFYRIKAKGKLVHFHKLPLKRSAVLSRWLEALRRENPPMGRGARVCSDHFLEEDYVEEKCFEAERLVVRRTNRLKPEAVPSVFNFPAKSSAKCRKSIRKESVLGRDGALRRTSSQTGKKKQVWLAALRETEKQESVEQCLICEDHFLPEDISKNGVHSDAIPIMPPCLDGSLGMISPWGAESEEEEEEEQGNAGRDEEDEVAEDEGGDNVKQEPPAPEPPSGRPSKTDVDTKEAPAVKATSDRVSRWNPPRTRQDVSLGVLTQRFLELLLASPDGTLDLRQVTTNLKTRKRRVYDITNVLDGIRLVEKESANRIRWIGNAPIASFLQRKEQKFKRELENLKLVEDTLDTLIKSCAQQLFDMTDDLPNSALAYVTHEDISRLKAFQEQTLIAVKAPEETKLEVPAPKEDSIQIHLKGGRGPIAVWTCDIGTGDDGSGDGFMTLEESRIKTTTLHTESSVPQSAVQSS
ncbi:transcription factor E2FC isoform X2 [Mugil cephalus]|uniref:transcription factor E2FC isoform X2 n=1 Tax=Mugil cephalus TaxID=48193 RepID=UPI001FB7E2A3|nr:transcription factor E2FC isoform X2 [Mugil cephalus]